MNINYSDPTFFEAHQEEYEEEQRILDTITSGCAVLGVRKIYPSFFGLHGRRPIVGIDYDFDAPMSEDDYAFFGGIFPYSDDVHEYPPDDEVDLS